MNWFNARLVLILVLVILVNPVITAENIENLPIIKPHAKTEQTHIMDYPEIRCMSTAIWYESGHESRLGKIAVARVIQNRMRAGFSDTICGVVRQRDQYRCQFSWVCGNYRLISEAECAVCWQIAYEILVQERHQNILKNALYFHATYTNPAWRNLVPIRVIGGHKFYRKS